MTHNSASVRFEVMFEDDCWKVFSYAEVRGRTIRNWVADGPSIDEAYAKRRIAERAMY